MSWIHQICCVYTKLEKECQRYEYHQVYQDSPVAFPCSSQKEYVSKLDHQKAKVKQATMRQRKHEKRPLLTLHQKPKVSTQKVEAGLKVTEHGLQKRATCKIPFKDVFEKRRMSHRSTIRQS
jgi:hypothetical protein